MLLAAALDLVANGDGFDVIFVLQHFCKQAVQFFQGKAFKVFLPCMFTNGLGWRVGVHLDHDPDDFLHRGVVSEDSGTWGKPPPRTCASWPNASGWSRASLSIEPLGDDPIRVLAGHQHEMQGIIEWQASFR